MSELAGGVWRNNTGKEGLPFFLDLITCNHQRLYTIICHRNVKVKSKFIFLPCTMIGMISMIVVQCSWINWKFGFWILKFEFHVPIAMLILFCFKSLCFPSWTSFSFLIVDCFCCFFLYKKIIAFFLCRKKLLLWHLQSFLLCVFQ